MVCPSLNGDPIDVGVHYIAGSANGQGDHVEHLIEAGVEIIQPVQTNATDMGDLHRLKREFGDRVVFHGAADNQGKFHKTPEIIEADVKEKMEALKPGGGYIFSSCHNIQSNCPPENIIALFDAAKKYGRY